MADRYKILRNVYKKLDALPLGFGIKQYSADMTDEEVDKIFGIDLDDTIREVRLPDLSSVEDNSYNEMQIENRCVYYALRRFRMSSAIFFKFSTAVDGKSVDKTQIPKMLSNIIAEYDRDFSKWRGSNIGSIWQKTKES